MDPGSTFAVNIAAPSPVESPHANKHARSSGASFGGVKGRDQVPELVDRYLAGDIDVDAFISHRLRLDDVNRGFELMEAQQGIRSVIAFA